MHGESIGVSQLAPSVFSKHGQGIVATHVARYCSNIELLVADRTFANLPAVAQRLVGTSLHSSCQLIDSQTASWTGKTLAWLTRWNTDNVSNFLEAKCYKIVCNDPDDEVRNAISVQLMDA